MDEDLSNILAETLASENVSVLLNSEVVEVLQSDGSKQVKLKDGTTLQADALLDIGKWAANH